MTAVTIKLKSAKKKGDKTIPTVEYDFGSSAADACLIFGGEVVHALFVQAARVQLTEWARQQLTRKKEPLSVEQLREGLADRSVWRPEIRRRGKTQLEKAQAAFDALSDDEKAKLAAIAAKFAPAQGPLKLKEEDVAPKSMMAEISLPHSKDR